MCFLEWIWTCVYETLKTAIFLVFYHQKLRSNEDRFCTYFIKETQISDAFYTIELSLWSLNFGFHAFSDGFLPLLIEAELKAFEQQCKPRPKSDHSVSEE